MVPTYPPWYICLSQELFTHGIRPVLSLVVPVVHIVACMYTGWLTELHFYLRGCTSVGVSRRKGASFTSEYSSFPRRNGPNAAKKPATESTPAQGAQECCNPSRTVVKPPSRLGPAF